MPLGNLGKLRKQCERQRHKTKGLMITLHVRFVRRWPNTAYCEERERRRRLNFRISIWSWTLFAYLAVACVQSSRSYTKYVLIIARFVIKAEIHFSLGVAVVNNIDTRSIQTMKSTQDINLELSLTLPCFYLKLWIASIPANVFPEEQSHSLQWPVVRV